MVTHTERDNWRFFCLFSAEKSALIRLTPLRLLRTSQVILCHGLLHNAQSKSAHWRMCQEQRKHSNIKQPNGTSERRCAFRPKQAKKKIGIFANAPKSCTFVLMEKLLASVCETYV